MPFDVVLAALLGAVLLVSAGFKITDRTGTAIAAGTYGLRGMPARWVWLPLAAAETALAAGLLAGWPIAGWLAAALLGAFAVAQTVVVVAGRGGAPCGCFGARGRVSWSSAARVALLAATAALEAVAHAQAGVTIRALAVAAALTVAGVVVLLARRASIPDGALEIDGEGAPIGTRIALDLPGAPVRLAFFGAEGCRLCRALTPHAERLGAVTFDEQADRHAWNAADVPGAPFAVALDADGRVLAKGTVNTRRQLASVAHAARERAGLGAAEPLRPAPSTQPGSSRRGFIAAAAGAVAALTVARTVGSLVKPGAADAHHFCGHTFTTDSCPHPTGLPRIDSRGFPLRAKDGVRVDDLGRRIGSRGAPIEEGGSAMLDADGRPLPPATRTRICAAAGRRYKISTRTDGSWHRCCNGHVRKLMDCCSTSSHRINGDRALKGYCYANRHVFCVMFFQSSVPC